MGSGDRRDANGAPDAASSASSSRLRGGSATGSRFRASRVGVALASQVLPLATRALARCAAEMARRRGRRGLRRSPRSCSLLPFISLPEYARLLRRLGATFDQDSFTLFGLLVQVGASDRARPRRRRSRSGSPSSRLPGGAQSFVLFVAAALMLSPIVWLDYYAVLAIPLAVVQTAAVDRSGCFPILTWGITSGGVGVGHVETSLRMLSIFAVITIVVARDERNEESSRARTRCDGGTQRFAEPSQACPGRSEDEPMIAARDSTSSRTTHSSCSSSVQSERSSLPRSRRTPSSATRG